VSPLPAPAVLPFGSCFEAVQRFRSTATRSLLTCLCVPLLESRVLAPAAQRSPRCWRSVRSAVSPTLKPPCQLKQVNEVDPPRASIQAKALRVRPGAGKSARLVRELLQFQTPAAAQRPDGGLRGLQEVRVHLRRESLRPPILEEGQQLGLGQRDRSEVPTSGMPRLPRCLSPSASRLPSPGSSWIRGEGDACAARCFSSGVLSNCRRSGGALR